MAEQHRVTAADSHWRRTCEWGPVTYVYVHLLRRFM
jgi:hypothetical protein